MSKNYINVKYPQDLARKARQEQLRLERLFGVKKPLYSILMEMKQERKDDYPGFRL